jgi:hypothetical protein
MKNSKYLGAITACLMSVSAFISAPTIAATSIDGSKDIVCAVLEVVACVEDSRCVQNTARGFDLPELMVVDSKKQVLRSTHESGQKATSVIKNVETNGSHLIIQGAENSRGWNIAINTQTGKMNGATVGDKISFLVFGTCTTVTGE